jgi:hypothetical protein
MIIPIKNIERTCHMITKRKKFIFGKNTASTIIITKKEIMGPRHPRLALSVDPF